MVQLHLMLCCLASFPVPPGLKASLERLQLEYVDVVFANRPDPNTPMEGKSDFQRLLPFSPLLLRHPGALQGWTVARESSSVLNTCQD